MQASLKKLEVGVVVSIFYDNNLTQESLANAKVSAGQLWYIGHNSLNRPSLAFFTVTPSTAVF